VDHELNRGVLLASEVGNDMYPVIDRCDERVAALRRILAQEGNVSVISVDDMLLVTAVSSNDAADEAVAAPNALLVRGHIERKTAHRFHGAILPAERLGLSRASAR
jgi:hypothetical protein